VANGFWAAACRPRTEIPHIPEDLNNYGRTSVLLDAAHHEKVVGQDRRSSGALPVAYDPAYYNIFLNVATISAGGERRTINNVGVPATAKGSGVQSAYLRLNFARRESGAGARPGEPGLPNPYVRAMVVCVERLINSRISLRAVCRKPQRRKLPDRQSNPLILCMLAFTGDTCTGTGHAWRASPQYIPSG